jgi:hypothetical protein
VCAKHPITLCYAGALAPPASIKTKVGRWTRAERGLNQFHGWGHLLQIFPEGFLLVAQDQVRRQNGLALPRFDRAADIVQTGRA